jgi:hypothetical protein
MTKTQVRAVIVMALAMLAWLGVKTSTTDAQINDVADGIGIVIGVIGSWITMRRPPRKDDDDDYQDGYGSASGGSRRLIAPLLLLGLMTAGGCSQLTDGQKLYLARQTYISAETATTQLVDAGLLDKHLDEVEVVRNEARAALAQAKIDLKNGNKLGFTFTYQRLTAILGRWAVYYAGKETPGEEPQSCLFQPSRRRPQLSPHSFPLSNKCRGLSNVQVAAPSLRPTNTRPWSVFRPSQTQNWILL